MKQNPENDKGIEVKQSNTLVSARYEMSAAELNIFIMLLHEMKRKDYQGNYFRISLAKLQEYSDNELNYSYIKEAAEKLLKRTARIIDKERHLSIQFISSVDFTSRNLLDTVDGNLFVELGVDSKILPYYKELETFTVFQLTKAINIQGKYSKRFYMLMSRFKSTGYYIVGLEDLKDTLGISKDTYKTWDGFKTYVIEPAERELKEANDVWFTWKVHKKQGKKITVLLFDIKTNNSEDLAPAMPVNEKIYDRLIKVHKLAEWQAKEVLKRVTEKDINALLYEILEMHRDGKIFSNIGSYTAKLFYDRHLVKIWSKPDAQPELPLK